MSFDSNRSGNSNSNSKRSLNSISSNNNNKKKKTNQKTLGVAWGANSLSSSRSSFRTAPFSDFGSYMAVKNKKLHDQFEAQASKSNSSCNDVDSVKHLFQGVSIFVDGFTIPSSQELRAYMMKHGGRFENYFSRRRVTHIICSNLPDSKIKNLRSFSRGLPVVKPMWVVDCVVAGKLLSWVPYQLDQLVNEASNQPKLSAFFSLKRNSVGQGVSSDSTCPLKAEEEAEGSVVRDDMPLDDASSDADELSECSRKSEKLIETADYEKTNTKYIEDRTFKDGGLTLLEIGKSVASNDKVEPDPLQPSASTSSPDICRKPSGVSSGLLARETSSHCHSSSEGPDFVENYFKSSRLHFIGTWRNRYRRRFACVSNNKIKQTNLDVHGSFTSLKAMIIHVDMDCFFVAVVIRSRPDLMDKPVAVCHSDNPRGTAEISSANYPARDYGVKAGMFVRDAKARCPHLVIVPYNFEAYEEVADQFYNILHKHCDRVQAMSCDEAFLDVTDSDVTDPELLVSEIRKEIVETTGCTASAGIATNMLMARLATRTAKPDGQCYIPPEKVDEYLLQLSIKSLPGVGHVLEQKLKKKGVQTCGQLQKISKESKSIGAEVNWGVRLKDLKDSEHFLLRLCKEVSLRLQGCGLLGRTFTLKIKKRRKNAGEPTKYMGCGDCENLSHSTTVYAETADSSLSLNDLFIVKSPLQLQIPVATHDVDILQRISTQLFGSFHIDVQDIRGIGLQVTKLESDDNMKQGHERNILRSWLALGTANSSEQNNFRHTGQSHLESVESSAMVSNPSCYEPLLNPIAALPSLDDLDTGVIESLPPELVSEINDMYGGRLTDLITNSKAKAKGKAKASCDSISALSMKEVEGKFLNEVEAHTSEGVQIVKIREKDEPGCSTNRENEALSAFGASTATIAKPVLESEIVDLMPSSLSQVDMSILQQLPDELRADIVKVLPTHRRSNCLPSSCRIYGKLQEVRPAVEKPAVENTKSMECADDNLWTGDPPCWVHKFKVSNCLMLKILAEMFLQSGSTILSSTLQHCLSGFSWFEDATDDVTSKDLYGLCELLRQYIQLKLETDIEEIYICFRLLKGLMLKSKDFKDVYDTVLPYLQASIRESYGGELNLPTM